jgi:hypothetical protein
MAITQALTTSFRRQLMLGEHDLDTDVLKLALYTSSATLGPSTTVYSSADEVVGEGYTAGGVTLTGVTVSSSNGVAYMSFNNPQWVAASFTCRGALIYNSTKSNKSIAVLDFGTDQTALGQVVNIILPPNNFTSAIIRLT